MSWSPKVLIAFHSENCPAETLATAIAEGAEIEGAEVRLRRAPELGSAVVTTSASDRPRREHSAATQADAEWADAIVFGTPTQFGTIAPELKAYVDALGSLWLKSRIDGKLGAAFGAATAKLNGERSALRSMFTPTAHLGLIIVRLGYADGAIFRTVAPHAATPLSGSVDQCDAGHLAVARAQGRRVASDALTIRRAGRRRSAHLALFP